MKKHTIKNSKPFTVLYGIDNQKEPKCPAVFAGYDWTDLQD